MIEQRLYLILCVRRAQEQSEAPYSIAIVDERPHIIEVYYGAQCASYEKELVAFFRLLNIITFLSIIIIVRGDTRAGVYIKNPSLTHSSEDEKKSEKE